MSSITDISPVAMALYEPAQTLTVNGSGFVNGTSIITIEGVNQPTTFVSANKLTTTFDPGAETDIGEKEVSVTDAVTLWSLMIGPPSTSMYPGEIVGTEPYEFHQMNSTLATLVGTVGWPAGAGNLANIGPRSKVSQLTAR